MTDRWTLRLTLTRGEIGAAVDPVVAAFRLVEEALPDEATATMRDLGGAYELDIAAPEAESVARRQVGAYCVDLPGDVYDGVSLPARVLLADPADPAMAALVADPAALDRVTWILNRDADWAAAGYSRASIQTAIWNLTDGHLAGVIDILDPDAAAIVAAAQAEGAGFIPGPGDVVGLIVAPEQETDPETGEDITNWQTVIYGVRYDLMITDGAPAAALATYPGAADPNWADCGFLVDFAYLHACGVRPGDTVWDMTGQHRFTIPAGSTLDEDGWRRGSGGALSIPASPLFDMAADWRLDVVFNPNGVDYDARNLIGCWSDASTKDWYLRQTQSTGAGRLGWRQVQVTYASHHSFTAGNPGWYHAAATYEDDAQRYYMTGVEGIVYSINVGGNANDASLTMETDATVRLARIGRNGGMTAALPGIGVAVPTVARAGAAPGQAFNPFTGLWYDPA